MHFLDSLKIATLALAAFGGASAAAASYPERSIRLIVPAAPGGAADFVSRIVGPLLAQKLGQSIVIENRAGASGTIGADLTAKAQPDGYTLLMAQSTSVTIAPHLYSKLGYDTLKDLAPVTLVATAPNILVVHPSVPVHTVQELVALAKAQPDRLNFGSAGSGAPSHLAGEMFNNAAGVHLTHVPYKGAGLAVNALLAGEIQVMFAPIVAVLPQVKANRLRAIALTSSQPSPAAPGVPTIAASGLPGYEISSWFGIFAPTGTPGAVIERLFSETRAVLQQPEVQERFTREGAEAVGSDPASFDRFVRAEYDRYARIVKTSGAKVD